MNLIDIEAAGMSHRTPIKRAGYLHAGHFSWQRRACKGRRVHICDRAKKRARIYSLWMSALHNKKRQLLIPGHRNCLISRNSSLRRVRSGTLEKSIKRGTPLHMTLSVYVEVQFFGRTSRHSHRKLHISTGGISFLVLTKMREVSTRLAIYLHLHIRRQPLRLIKMGVFP